MWKHVRIFESLQLERLYVGDLLYYLGSVTLHFTTLLPTFALGKIPWSFWMLFCPSQKLNFQLVKSWSVLWWWGRKTKEISSYWVRPKAHCLKTIGIHLVHESVGQQSSLDSSSDLTWNCSLYGYGLSQSDCCIYGSFGCCLEGPDLAPHVSYIPPAG